MSPEAKSTMPRLTLIRTADDDQRDRAALLAENQALRQQVFALESFRALAYRDGLTSLWNRRYFDERFREELARVRRNPAHRFSVLIVDMNGLKRINDEQGHAAGDEAISWIAAFLRRTLREYDICCRLGGDEFALILPDAGTDECQSVVRRLRNALEVANRKREQEIGLSFGGATCPGQGTTFAQLLTLADAQMYADKRRQKSKPGPRARAPQPSVALEPQE